MDIEKLIDQDACGTYCILFQNRERLELKEIEEIFSQFGEVYNIKTSGDERGYRFIRYKYMDEVQNAIEGLKNHPKIKLAAHRCKTKINLENQTFIRRNTENTDYKGKQFKNKNEKTNYKKKNSNNEEYKKNTAESETVVEEKYLNRSFDNDKLSVESDKSLVGIKNNSFEENLWKSSSRNESDSVDSTPTSVGGINSKYAKVLNFVNNRELSKSSEDDIPDLIKPSGKVISAKNTQKKVIFNAEEVIVGNIHPKFGASYILHLFDRFEPIAISKVNVVPNTGTRYCHVYFKTAQDSMGVETLFDQKDLSGKKLVVLRPCRLMEEGSC